MFANWDMANRHHLWKLCISVPATKPWHSLIRKYVTLIRVSLSGVLAWYTFMYCIISSCSWLVVDLFVQVTVWMEAQQHRVQLKVNRGATCFTFKRALSRSQSCVFCFCRRLVEVGWDCGNEDEESRLCCCFPARPDDRSRRTWWDIKLNFLFTASTLQPKLMLLHCCYDKHVSTLKVYDLEQTCDWYIW